MDEKRSKGPISRFFSAEIQLCSQNAEYTNRALWAEGRRNEKQRVGRVEIITISDLYLPQPSCPVNVVSQPIFLRPIGPWPKLVIREAFP